MALLTRYMQLSSPEETHVFNFVVTKSVTRDLSRDVVSKDFVFGSHRWALGFNHQEKALGISLLWKSPSDGMHVNLKVVVTLLNREYFGENRSFQLTKANFDKDNISNGDPNFIKLADLLTHRPRFTDHNGEFQVELKLSNIETYFEKEVLIQSKKHKQPRNSSSGEDEDAGETDHFDALETVSNEFTYGNFLWTLRLRPQPLLGVQTAAQTASTKSSWTSPIQKVLQQQRINSSLSSGDQNIDHLGLSAMLQRQPSRSCTNNNRTGMSFNDLLARLKYKITFLANGKTEKNDIESSQLENGVGDKERLCSEAKEEVFTIADSSTAFAPRVRLSHLYSKRIAAGGLLSTNASSGYVKVRVDLQAADAITEFCIKFPNGNEIEAPLKTANAKQTWRDAVKKQKGDTSADSNAPKFGDTALLLKSVTEMKKNDNKKKPLSKEKTITLMTNNNGVNGLDSDTGNWQVDCDLNSSFLRCSMVYQDVFKIPRNHLRFVQWRAFLVRRSRRWRGLREDRAHQESVEFQAGHSFRCYYIQDDSDPGTVMETSVPSKDVKEGLSEFLEQDGRSIKVRILWELNYLLFQATFNGYDEVARFHNVQMRSEIATLTEKVRALEIAQVNQRKQQAIIMASLAAEKLKKQKNNEFQSDSNLSNLTYYSGNQGSLDPNAGDQPNNLLNHAGEIHRQQRLVLPMGKRLLLKPHLSLDSGMTTNGNGEESSKEGGSRQQHLNVTFSSAKTAPSTPVGVGVLPAKQRAHLSRTNSCGIGASPSGFRQNSHHQRSASQKYMTGRRPVINERRSVSPQPRIITSMASCEVNQKPSPMIRNGLNSTRSAPLSQDKSQIEPIKPPLEKARSHSPNGILATDTGGIGITETPPPTPPFTSNSGGSFLRFWLPLKKSFSVSADNLPKPLSMTSLAKNLAGRPSNCQSFEQPSFEE